MDEWTRATLGELAAPGRSVISGPFGSNIGTKFFKSEGVPVIRGNNLTTDHRKFVDDGFVFVTEDKAEDLDTYAVENDLLFTAAGTIGQVGMIPNGARFERYVISNKQIRFRADANKIDLNYLYAWLSSPWTFKSITNRDTGSTVPLINLSVVRSLAVSFPKDVGIQREIGDIFRTLDAKIDLNNRINAELEAMAKTIYDYWFVQFDFPDADGRPYRSNGGAMVWNDTLKREIPTGWSALPLLAWIARKKNGEWGAGSASDDNDAQAICIRGADIDALNGRGELRAPTRYIPPSKMEKYLAPYDLVVEISGGSPKQSTGRAALVGPEVIERFDVPLVCSNFCKALTLKDASHSYLFLQQWNALYNAGVFFGWEGKTSGIKNLQFDSFVSHYHAPEPPDALSRRFHELCCSLDQRKQNGLNENRELTRLRDWLLPLLMNGQVRVGRNGVRLTSLRCRS
ncbi:MAG TPA: restriction endonuclease subunit S [Oleiagrimonas sp.]|nr:restriction endonuclease subunit S [Oleiagrimonas sp.]